MTELELKIKMLEIMLEAGDWCYPYSHFEEETGESRESVKKVMDSLRKIDMVEHAKGLMTEEGETAGSGFCLTHRAKVLSVREWLAELKKISLLK